ncbi:hypothetical protein Tco_0009222 [Tanacetum coccineum]
MNDPNITIEEYIRLEEEKARMRVKVYNWETAMYGKIWDNKDVHDLGSVETEFSAIVFNDTITSEAALLCEPMVSYFNNDEIDFRISYDETDDEDCTIIFDKKLFSYKIISVNDLKTDSENDNDKVNMPLLPPPEPTVSCFDDLDFFKDFENEFPVIVYNNAQMSKSGLLTEPILNPQHIDEFDLKDETSLSECDEEKQNVLYFNDLFSFNIIYLDDSKSDEDNDDDKINIEHSLGDLSVKPLPDVINTNDGAYAHGSNKLLETSFAATLAFLVTKASQSRQHVDTSLIHIESRKSPTKSFYDVGSSKISIFTLVPSCCVIFDLEPLSLSFDFVFTSKIFKSLSFSLDRLYHLAILCLDQHAHTLHHVESLLIISLDRLEILKEDLVYQSSRKSLSLILELS